MSISGDIKQTSGILRSAVTSIYNWKDIEICPVCKKQLINGECPEGHNIRR